MSLGLFSRWWSGGAADRYRHSIAYAVMILSSLALLPALDGFVHGDVHLYQSVAGDLVAGKLPYRDRVLEYPPYAIPIFLLPRLFGESTYSSAFMYLVLVADWLLKLFLFALGSRQSDKLRSFLPLFCYCVAIPFLRFFFLQRYDVWPALICMLALWLFCSGRYALSGLCFAAGVGVKLYPIVFLPPLLLLAARQGKARQFLGATVVGLMPIAMLSFVLPWWRFAEFHGARGLQGESLYASVIWLAKQLGLAQAKWSFAKAWIEVQGPVAERVLPWARLVFAAAVLFSVGLVTWVAACCQKPSIGRLARLLMVPLLGFVAFNQVLSPQYLVWILPMAALGMLEGEIAPVLWIFFATMVTPIFYPALPGHYLNGLTLLETAVLVFRNLVLVIVWLLLIRELLPEIRRAGWVPLAEIRRSILTLFWRHPGPGELVSKN